MQDSSKAPIARYRALHNYSSDSLDFLSMTTSTLSPEANMKAPITKVRRGTSRSSAPWATRRLQLRGLRFLSGSYEGSTRVSEGQDVMQGFSLGWRFRVQKFRVPLRVP